MAKGDATGLRDRRARRRSLVAALFVSILAACTPLTAQQRTDLTAAHQREGESALTRRDYPAAAAAYRQAWQLSPDSPALPHRLGIVDEHLRRYADAAAAYEAALELAPPPPLREELIHRLALLYVFRLDRPQRLDDLLRQLPADSPYAADLRGVAALLRHDHRQALAELNRAASTPIPPELASTILYHAARAYHLGGERDLTLKTLYQAINLAEFSPIAYDIAEFKASITAR